jgi:hypothetical protein
MEPVELKNFYEEYIRPGMNYLENYIKRLQDRIEVLENKEKEFILRVKVEQ